MNRQNLNIIALFLLFAVSCKVLPTKPYLANKAEIVYTPETESKLTKVEKIALRTRLFAVQDDSVKVTKKDILFFIHIPVNPIVYDTAYSKNSARNMEASLRHLGYYKAKVTDTAFYKTERPYKLNFFNNKKVIKVNLKYTVNTDIATRIESFNYKLKDSALQAIAINSKEKSFVKVQEPVTKTAILLEIARLVDSFRNNGYYKFTASELRMRGDSSIAALTNISDDPIEQLEALIEAQKKKDSPTIKLALVIVRPEDSTKLNKYTINKIYIISDFRQGDNVAYTKNFYYKKSNEFIHYFHNPVFKTALLERNLTLKKGDVFRQNDFYSSINNLTKLGVWQNVNIRLVENIDSANSNKLDIIVELSPAKKLTPSLTLDINYSAAGNNNTGGIAGNLFGTSLNFSVENKNLAKEAIKMAHNFRFGIEFRNKKRSLSNNDNPIQSNEVSYSNDINIPRFFYPTKYLDPRYGFYKINSPKSAEKKYSTDKKETFINTNFSYSNRLDYFNLQNIGLAYGYRSKNAKNNIFTFKLLNVAYSNLYNRTYIFDSTLDANPFLKYSYNTAFVIGTAFSYTSTKNFKKKQNNNQREGIFRLNFEESGLTWGSIPKNENLKKYVKQDAEYKYNIAYSKKRSLNFRGFMGIGIPLKDNDALPFFKQFAAGGSSSMRGWPIRGVGRGGQTLAPFTAVQSFNDRTGDIQIEINGEYRHFITKIYTELITLKGAFFIDAGNIWNFKESYDQFGVSQNTRFNFDKLGKQFGVSAGYGLRFDLTYLVLRTDFGFRIKRPETSDIKNGWKFPDMSFDDIFQKIISKNYRDWRYENFNFSFGINYPF
jgi:outer membrane protein insertion porin family